MAPPPEISIPSTIAATSNSKPYTLYNITLRLPLRSFVTQKRYSEFAELHAALTSQAGSAPPSPLPSKSWFKSTISSVELTEDRRRGLEAYLRAIAESPDRRWRDTQAWRSFFSLPSPSAAASTVSAHGIVSSAAAGAADPPTWLDIHREMKACLHEARNHLTRRDTAIDATNTTVAAEAGAAAKRQLVKAGTLVTGLSDGLRIIKEGNKLGEGEIRRRRDLLSAARLEREGLERLSNALPTSPDQGRSTAVEKAGLLGTRSGPSGGVVRGGGRVIGAPAPETARTRELDNGQVLLLQQQVMEEQETDLKQLSAIVQRQKDIGLAIQEEVQQQTTMLSLMNDDVDRVQGKMRVAQNRIKRL